MLQLQGETWHGELNVSGFNCVSHTFLLKQVIFFSSLVVFLSHSSSYLPASFKLQVFQLTAHENTNTHLQCEWTTAVNILTCLTVKTFERRFTWPFDFFFLSIHMHTLMMTRESVNMKWCAYYFTSHLFLFFFLFYVYTHVSRVTV